MIKEREHAIGYALTCIASKKALIHRQILSGDKEGSRDSMKVVLSVARLKDKCPVAKIENQLILNFSAQILLSNKC